MNTKLLSEQEIIIKQENYLDERNLEGGFSEVLLTKCEGVNIITGNICWIWKVYDNEECKLLCYSRQYAEQHYNAWVKYCKGL
jgi:hypothetical protein